MKSIDNRITKLEKMVKIYSEDVKKLKKFSPFFLDKLEDIEKRISFLESRFNGLEQIISKISKIDKEGKNLFEMKVRENEMSIHDIESKVNRMFNSMKNIEERIKKSEEIWSSLDNSFLALKKQSESSSSKKGEKGESFKILLNEIKKHREAIIKSRRRLKEISEQVNFLKEMTDRLENKKIDDEDFEKLKTNVDVLNKRLEEVLKLLLEKTIG